MSYLSCDLQNSVTKNTRVELQIIFVTDGITIKIMLETLTKKQSFIQEHLIKHSLSQGLSK